MKEHEREEEARPPTGRAVTVHYLDQQRKRRTNVWLQKRVDWEISSRERVENNVFGNEAPQRSMV
jgi:hypothetical protein